MNKIYISDDGIDFTEKFEQLWNIFRFERRYTHIDKMVAMEIKPIYDIPMEMTDDYYILTDSILWDSLED